MSLSTNLLQPASASAGLPAAAAAGGSPRDRQTLGGRTSRLLMLRHLHVRTCTTLLLPFLSCLTNPPLLPLPPTKHATFPFSPRPPSSNGKTANQPAVAATQRRDKRKKPRAPRMEPATAQKRRPPLERAAPLPPAPAVAEALDDLEQEVARRFVEELLHALAPPPSSLPLPTFSVVTAAKAPLLQAAALDGAADVGRLLRL